ncbi:hypothetical protein H650_23895 [Enterobacter sp. R4-368]|nr:hypothetical protein H650_23895 [Enterobacter sp. R4-368]
MPACINLTGESRSTADIELLNVVGVHAQLNAAYLFIEDG